MTAYKPVCCPNHIGNGKTNHIFSSVRCGQIHARQVPAGSGIKSSVFHFGHQPPPPGEEKNGVEYHFLSPDEFRKRIANDEFLEFEEVYTDKFYGTLKSEVDRILGEGKNVVFDVDCIGG